MKSKVKIEDFKGIKIDVKYEDIIDRNAEACAEWLKNSPSTPRGHRKSNSYRSGWAVKKGRKQKDQYYAEVWNATNYQLTHLLENGHLITNKRGGVGWAEGQPHIQKAFDYVKPTFLAEIDKAEIDVGFE